MAGPELTSLFTAASFAAGAYAAFSHQACDGDEETRFEVFARQPRGDSAFLLEAEPGESLPLGYRNGTLVTAQLTSRRRGLEDTVFYDGDRHKAHEIELDVRENGTAGLLHFFLTPTETVLFNINTKDQDKKGPAMAPGAGTVLLTWLATQALLRGAWFAVTGIENPGLLDMLQKRRLLAPRSGTAEFYQSDDGDRFQYIRRIPWDGTGPLTGLGKVRLEYPYRFLLARGRPNPLLTSRVSVR